MRCLLIDPFKRTITEEQLLAKGKTYEIFAEELKAMVGSSQLGFSRLGTDVQMVYDDMGIYREGQKFFDLQGYRHTLGGRFLLTGLDEAGESIALPHRVTKEQVERLITWRNIKFVGMEHSKTRVDTALGPADRLEMIPKFEELQ